MALTCINAAGACSGCGVCMDTLQCSICGAVIFPPFYTSGYVQICRVCAATGGGGKCVLCGSSTNMLVCVGCQKNKRQRTDVIRN